MCIIPDWTDSGQYLYLIPVEHQTLCCVVSVFVVLKKLTPYKEDEKKTYLGTFNTLVHDFWLNVTECGLKIQVINS